ncbi:MurR/RpiR family transcriptional regulator [Enterococcus gallinarum]|uniref:MurR/RpiR family transcriptional regulator n=1 Tax=Enterococcus gallinarum TaxID=1353 RepID=UPI001C8C4784|nr:MurR/RpiR family transcriptional regulator [Enterococcus gallinarum]MBX8977364.1 MurR/RpiR family transcriptional regulator [Enterococcus gallinarum]
MDPIRSIRQKYKGFSKVNKRIADYILKDPTRLLSLTANEIANNSDTSPASVTRFSKQLGFDSWEELKLSIAAKQASSNGKKDIDPIVAAGDSIDTICMKVESLLSATIEDLFYTVDKKAVERAINHLKKAEKIYLVGIGASSLTTYNLYHKLNRAGRQAIFNYDSHMMLEFLNYSTEQDILIAVSYSGLSKEALIACEIAKNREAKVIFITSNDGQRIQELSDEVLLVPNNEHLIRVGAISSIASSMAIADVLYLGSIQDELDTEIERNMIETSQLVSRLKEN